LTLKGGLFGFFFQQEQCFSLTPIQLEQCFSAKFSQANGAKDVKKIHLAFHQIFLGRTLDERVMVIATE